MSMRNEEDIPAWALRPDREVCWPRMRYGSGYGSSGDGEGQCFMGGWSGLVDWIHDAFEESEQSPPYGERRTL